jgi:hypothetical protein
MAGIVLLGLPKYQDRKFGGPTRTMCTTAGMQEVEQSGRKLPRMHECHEAQGSVRVTSNTVISGVKINLIKRE